MPRKPLKSTRSRDTKINRVRAITNSLVGNETSDDLMEKILESLNITEKFPTVGKFYTFVYFPKTSGIEYDTHPLVGVTNIFNWGFKGINFHWGKQRQYTWDEIVGDLHLVYSQELKDLQAIPFKRIRINS